MLGPSGLDGVEVDKWKCLDASLSLDRQANLQPERVDVRERHPSRGRRVGSRVGGCCRGYCEVLVWRLVVQISGQRSELGVGSRLAGVMSDCLLSVLIGLFLGFAGTG